MSNTKRLQILLTTILLTFGFGSLQHCQAGSIEKQLQARIPKIIEYLSERKLKTVGVLKFRVKKPGQKTSDSVGSINSLLADRLEVGLILENPFEEPKRLNVIKGASQQVSRIDGANHLSAEGRAVCFSSNFEIAWGDSQMKPDAFLTGVVQVHQDNQHVTVGILCFNKDGQPLQAACDPFQAELNASSLSEIGDSFLLRGGYDSRVINGLAKSLIKANNIQKPEQLTQQQVHEVKQKVAIKAAAEVRTRMVPFPLADPDAPVRLEVIYDGQQVPVEIRDGEAFIPEPQTGQKVEFALVRGSSVEGPITVVLKVNGENTLYRQTDRAIDCSKWVLLPEYPRVVIRGYQMRDGKTMEEFQVLSREESAKRAMNYGRNFGKIQLTVFRQIQKGPEEPDLLDESDQDMLAMMRATQPDKKPKTLSALKQQIRKPGEDQIATRGAVVPGQKKGNKVRKISVKSDPTPIMAVSITYYTP